MMAPEPYYCINCGHQAPHVYKTYAEGNLIKLLSCQRCGEIIDKYVEYDPVLIGINLILQNQLAFRHVLLNHAFEAFWKLGIVFLFCEAYCHWCFEKGMAFESNYSDFYEIEINFYRVLLRTLFGTLFFHSSFLFSCYLRFSILKEKPPPQFSYHTMWKGLNLCSFSEILEMVALVWAYSYAQSRIYIINGLFVLSSIQCYQVITDTSTLKSTVIAVVCFAIKRLAFTLYDYWIPS